MTTLQSGYQALLSCHENDAETPQDSDVMMIHVVPESGKSRWNHIEDLDSFFARVYHYHQRHGFLCMTLHDVLELFQFVFVVVFTTFMGYCVDYPLLFRQVSPPKNTTKVTIGDVIYPPEKCISRFGPGTVLCLIIALVFWLLRVIKVIYCLFLNLEIKLFYTSALKISKVQLHNMTWHEVQQRLLEVQCEQQMCIHKRELTELDIYHRILRYKNYMVAMVNKDLLPLKFNIPMFKEIVFFTKGLKYNLEMILFWGPMSPFKNTWHLKEDFKKVSKRKELAEKLSRHILLVAIANFILCPLILLWQVLYSFFSYADLAKREPGSLGSRVWSLYGRLYIRHFNELDHELNARLNRGYKAAKEYVGSFSSPNLSEVARLVGFVSGAITAFLIALSLYDEDVLNVEHVITVASLSGMLVGLSRTFVPDENLVFCPEKLMTNILAHIHYIPDHWKGNAHTFKVRDEFAMLFQYRAVYIIEELISPIVTPFILCFCLRPRALDIVDFFRNFTVDVVGVGDVCSFAQMDIRRHGNPTWAPEEQTKANQYHQAEHGKTELSLMHFTLTNPKWIPPPAETAFLNTLKEQAINDVGKLYTFPDENPLYFSLHSLHSLGDGYRDTVNSLWRIGYDRAPGGASIFLPPETHSIHVNDPNAIELPCVRGGLSGQEGPVYSSQSGLLTSIHQNQLSGEGIPSSSSTQGPALMQPVSLEYTATNMSFSTLYMHEQHVRTLRRLRARTSQASLIWQRPLNDMPGILESPLERGDSDERGEHRPLLLDTRLAKSS